MKLKGQAGKWIFPLVRTPKIFAGWNDFENEKVFLLLNTAFPFKLYMPARQGARQTNPLKKREKKIKKEKTHEKKSYEKTGVKQKHNR